MSWYSFESQNTQFAYIQRCLAVLLGPEGGIHPFFAVEIVFSKLGEIHYRNMARFHFHFKIILFLEWKEE